MIAPRTRCYTRPYGRSLRILPLSARTATLPVRTTAAAPPPHLAVVRPRRRAAARLLLCSLAVHLLCRAFGRYCRRRILFPRQQRQHRRHRYQRRNRFRRRHRRPAPQVRPGRAPIKAIILHIDSPGGAAAPSQEIYHEVLAHSRTSTKSPSSPLSKASAPAAPTTSPRPPNKIYANQASVVGSIGVIMEWTSYGNLMQWAKLTPEVIHAGALKDAGDPTREMTPEERAYFQGLVDNMYGQFVARRRHQAAGSAESQIKAIATGQVWTGEQALPLHLIDETERLSRRPAGNREIRRHLRRAQRRQARGSPQNLVGPADLQRRRPLPQPGQDPRAARAASTSSGGKTCRLLPGHKKSPQLLDFASRSDCIYYVCSKGFRRTQIWSDRPP